MRTLKYSLLGALFILMLNAVPSVVFAQQQPATNPDSQSAGHQKTQGQENAPKAVRGLEMEGKLKAIDTEKQIFLITAPQSGNSADQKEQGNRNDAQDTGMKEYLFHYDQQTEVVGESNGVQGLSGDAGTRVRIAYRAEGTKAIAEKIEIVSDSSAQQEGQNPEGNSPGRR